MAAADVAVDLGYLSTHLGVPETTLTTVATEPTVDLVKVVLQAVIVKAREFDSLYTEKLQVDIELENAVRSSEARCQTFKATADKSLKEVEEVRRKLQSEESARQSLETELQQAKSSGANIISEIENLRKRIASLETSNRETLAVVESKASANEELLKDLQRLQQKNTELGKQVAELQQSIQAEKAAANSAKWREQNLQQELKLTKQNNEWFETELKTKQAEANKYRKEKGARIAELERQNDEARSTIESLNRSEQQLRSRLNDAQRKAEEALSKVQQLQEAAARSEESFHQEIESSKRLVELKEQQTETSRKRLQDVERRLEHLKDEDENRIRLLQKEVQDEKDEHSKTIEHVAKLEEEVNRLEAMLSSQGQVGPAPQTPRTNGSLLRAGSPFGTPGSLRGKTSISATQAIEELWKVKTELIGEKKRGQQLSQDLDEVMTVLEAKGPELNELQEEAERLRNENIQMTQLADESYQERDSAKKAARKAEASLSTAQAETKILQAQLRDLGIQIQVLVFNLQAREKGHDDLTQDEISKFEQLQRGETVEGALDDMSDTHRFITERFVAFKDISELQSKNQELLRITRELADKMESEEALAEKQQAANNEKQVVVLQETVSSLKDEVKSMTIRMKSHMQERDMFRRLLQGKANAQEINSALGVSVEGSQREVLASIEQTSNVDEAELTVALRELQSNFDQYRNEQGIDRKTMREQVDKLSAEKNALQGEIIKIRSQLDLASERYSMLQSNYEALQMEKSEVQKRSQVLSETAAKQDVRTQQLAADLVDTKALLDSLNTKCANLEAEKELGTSIRDRLSHDNENLSQEKARLSTLLTQQQTLLNEREMSESEAKRRLNEQIDSLKTELEATKRKMFEEIESAKKLQQNSQYEAQQHQKRVDDLVSSLNSTKEELVAAKTTKDHLQARVDELTIELRNAQEKAERLQPRPTPRPGTLNEPAAADAETDAQIQELVNEVGDLKRDLDLANTHLENAKTQVEQYKELSQAAEEELSNYTSTQEQYREEIETSLASKDAQIKDLQQRVEDLSTELANSNNELSSIRDSQADFTRKFEESKRILDGEITQLKGEADRLREKAKFHQQDLRIQADIAKKAQQDYEHELVKHAEAAKALQTLRAQHNELRTSTASLRAEAESAKHTLDDNKRSFAEREQQLRQEVSELKERRKETDQQNKMLQEQLNSVTSQIASIKENRAAFVQNTEDTTVSVPGSDTERLLELNSYLSREKDIIEVQYNLKVNEAQRLQQQLDIKQSQLDETRLKLEQERVARADSRASITHDDLMNKLNELNLIRESNVTLRSENKRLEKQLSQRNDRIKELSATIEPLQNSIAELEGRKTFLEEELKQLGEDRDRWQKRTEGILTKYGRVDPAEMEQLKQTVSDLEAQRDALKQSEEPLKARITELETSLESDRAQWRATREKIVEQAKERSRTQSARIAEIHKEKEQLQQSLDEATERLHSLQTDLDAAVEARSQLEQQIKDLQQEVEMAKTTEQALAAQTQATAAPEQISQLEQQLDSIRQELAVAKESKTAAEQDLAGLRSQLATAIQERDAALAQAQQPSAENTTETPAVVVQNGIASTEPQEPVAATSDPDRAELEKKLADAEAKVVELEAKVEEAQQTLDRRSQKMKEQLNKRLADSKADLEKQLTESKDKMQSDFDLRLQQERAIWQAEHSLPADASSAAISTPLKPANPHTDPQTPIITPDSDVSTMLAADFLKLNDSDTRKVLSENHTLKAIVSNNMKRRLEQESKKLKEEAEQQIKIEWEAKVAGARDQATLMESKKSSLRINMAENKLKNANAKLHLVETAAKDTPERPVAEVWALAKDARATPSTTATHASSSPASLNRPPPAATHTAVSSTAESTTSETRPSGLPQPPKHVSTVLSASSPTTTAANPFSTAAAATQPGAANNPFASMPQQQGHPQIPPSHLPQPPAQAQHNQNQQQRTGIPVPRGGNHTRGGRGAYQHPRGGWGGQFSTQGRNASSGNLNPAAENFNPGNKRPRESGTGPAGGGQPKRQRGGGGGQHRGG